MDLKRTLAAGVSFLALPPISGQHLIAQKLPVYAIVHRIQDRYVGKRVLAHPNTVQNDGLYQKIVKPLRLHQQGLIPDEFRSADLQSLVCSEDTISVAHQAEREKSEPEMAALFRCQGLPGSIDVRLEHPKAHPYVPRTSFA